MAFAAQLLQPRAQQVVIPLVLALHNDGGRHVQPTHPAIHRRVHDAAALFMILALMAHVYLATIVNPHSLRSLFGGRVSLAWAKEHHSLWKSVTQIGEDQ
ncbi:MAG: hypothetical protein NTU83_09775 [Candidatus Hydrogenedentes bacterium]|nr:hypothetical protein [Candidatus Hydrogenedentota bacterium]